MNKKLFLIGIPVLGALILLGVVAVNVLKIGQPSTPPPPVNYFPTSPTTVPTSSSSPATVPTVSVSTINGGTIIVKNFILLQTTMPDPSNPGNYYLSGTPDVTVSHAPYQIFFSTIDKSFGITLYKEPLGQYRKQAEQELQKDLGISNDQLCTLNYYISAGTGVSPVYSNKNLGFSFCPGATALP